MQRSVSSRLPRSGQAVGDCSIRGNAVWYSEGQNYLGPVDPTIAEERISLIDQIEDRPDNQRDKERSPRHTIGDTASANLKKARRLALVGHRCSMGSRIHRGD